MNRPYVICHMLVSKDNKVTGSFLQSDECKKAVEEYYEINRNEKPDAYACGRVTMEGSFTFNYYPDLSAYSGAAVDKSDYVAVDKSELYCVAFDRKGRLGYKSNTIEDSDPGYGGAHIIQVLTEQVSPQYLSYLKDMRISYIFAGEKEMNVSVALCKLHRLFGINKLLLEGGSIINGAFMKEGLVDEVSLVWVNVKAEKDDKPLFYGYDDWKMPINSSKVQKDGCVIIRSKIHA